MSKAERDTDTKSRHAVVRGAWKGKKQGRDTRRYKPPATTMKVIGTMCTVWGIQSVIM